jgi:WD40 repeat protein
LRVALSTIYRAFPELKYDATNAASYSLLRDRTLAGIKDRGNLVQAEWPSLQESLRVVVPGEAGMFRFSADRKTLIHLVDQSLVCRRVSDFSTLWKRPVNPEIDLKARWSENLRMPSIASADYALSADGNTVAFGPSRAEYEGKPAKSYIEILRGNDGSPVAQWPRDSGDKMVLSPDGRLLAVGEIAATDVGALRPIVRVYSVPSGREVAVVVHDRMPADQRLNASLAGGLEFSPDGRYLITSANNKVKVWQMELVD